MKLPVFHSLRRASGCALLVLAASLTTLRAMPASQLMPYGAAAGDVALTQADDTTYQFSLDTVAQGGTPAIFPFFGVQYGNIFLDNNGMFSLTAGISQYVPQAFPAASGYGPIIAPFWADVDTRALPAPAVGTGKVWYRFVSDTATMTTIGTIVKNSFLGVPTFTPTFAIVTTWDHVGYYSGHVDKVNTFQAILASDGFQTYVVYQYPDGGINWLVGDASSGVDPQVGFDADDGVNYYNAAGTRTTAMLNLPSLSNTVPAFPGRMAFRVDGGIPTTLANPLGTAANDYSWAGANGSNWTGVNWLTPASGTTLAAWAAGKNAVFGTVATATLNAATTAGGLLVEAPVTITSSSAADTLGFTQLQFSGAGSLTLAGAAVLQATTGGAIGTGGSIAPTAPALTLSGTSHLNLNAQAAWNSGAMTLKDSSIVTSTVYGGAYGACNLTFNGGGTFQLGAGSCVVGSLTSTSTAGTVTDPSATIPAYLAINFDGVTAKYSGVITNAAGGGLSLVKQGTGTQILAGANTYTGSTAVTSGVLQFASPSAFYNGVTTHWTNGSFIVRSGATGAFNVGGAGEFSSAQIDTIRLGSGNFQPGAFVGLDPTDAAGGTYSYASAVAGSYGIEKLGTGNLILSGNSTYTGGTVVAAGTLTLQGATSTGTGPVTVDASATLVGTGTVSGSLILQPDGLLNVPSTGLGAVGGNLTWGGHDFAGSQIHLSTIGYPVTSASRLAITGALLKGSGNEFAFDFGGTAVPQTTYTLATFASTTFSAGDFSVSGLQLPLVAKFTIVNGKSLQVMITTPPSFSGLTAGSGTVGEPFTDQLPATSPNGIATFSATGMPAFLSINPTTGRIFGVPTAIGPYDFSVTAVDTLGFSSTVGYHLDVTAAVATFTLSNLSQVYSGAAEPVTVSVSPANLIYKVTYNGSFSSPVAAGSYTVVAMPSDPNYTGSATGTLVISKAGAGIVLGALSQTYGGAIEDANAATNPPNLKVLWTYNGQPLAFTPVGGTLASYAGAAGQTLDVNVMGVITGTSPGSGPSYPLATDVNSAALASGTVAANQSAVVRVVISADGMSFAFAGIASDGFTTGPEAAGTYSVTGTVTDPNYTGTVNGTLTIAPAVPVVNFPAPLPASILYGTPLGAGQLAATANVPGTFTYTPAAGTVLPAGLNQTLTVQFTPADALNYSSVTATATISVGQAPAVVTFSDLAATYDGTAKAPTVTTSPAGLAVSIAFDGGSAAPIVAGAHAVVATIADPNYTGSATATFTIAQGQPVVSWTSPAAIAYGTALDAGQLNATASVPGTFTYAPAAGTILHAGSQPLQATFTPADPANYLGGAGSTTLTVNPAAASVVLANLTPTYNGTPQAASVTTVPAGLPVAVTYNGSAAAPTTAGTYAVAAVVANPDYAGGAAAQLVIAKAAPALAWPAPAAIVYGTALSGTQLDATASQPGNFAYTPVAGTVLNAGGNQALAAIFTPADSVDYTAGSVSTTLTVNQQPVTISLNGLSQTYTGSARPISATSTPSGVPVAIAYNGSAAAPTAAGTYAVAVNVTDPNYSGSATGTLVVAKAIATATLGALSQTYGGTIEDANIATNPPGLTVLWTYNGQPLAFTPSDGTLANYAPAVGQTIYIHVTGAANGVTYSGPNYPIGADVNSAALQAGLVIAGQSAVAQVIISGDGSSFQFGGVATVGYTNGPVAAGTYQVAGTIVDWNYSGAVDGTLAIDAAILTVTADAQTKVFGAADPALTYGVSGLAPGDTASSVVSGTLTRVSGETVAGGPYAILAGSIAVSGNYSLNYVGANLAITQASATVLATGYSGVYDGQVHTGSASATGAGGANLAALVIFGAGSSSVPGGAQTWLFHDPAGNYADQSGTVPVTIAAAPASVAALNAAKVYGTSDPLLGAVGAGFLPADRIVTGASRTGGENVGTYAIVPAAQGAALANYQITATPAVFTIAPAPATVTAAPASKTYGAADPALTGTLNGFLPGDGITATYSRAAGETVAGGPYAITPSLVANAALNNYTVTVAPASLAITPAGLTVAAQPQSKTYGGVDPALAYSVSGLQFSDTASSVVTGNLTRAAGETVAGGPYAIGQGTLAVSTNYTLAFHPSALTVNPAVLSVTAPALAKVYGSADPALMYSANGFMFTDSATNSMSGALTRAAGETVAGGPYAITQGSLAASSNYTVAFTSGSLAITPAALTVTALAQTKVYGSGDPALTFTAAGFQLNDGVASALSGALARVPGESVAGAPYAILQGALAASSNYALTFHGNNLNITPAAATIAVTGYTGAYDGAAHGATGRALGVGNATLQSLLNLGDSFTAVPGGTASWTFHDPAGNYADQSGSVAIKLNAAALTITLGILTQTYDGTAKAVSVVTSPAGIATTVTYNGASNAPKPAGKYAVSAISASANYVGSASGTLTIQPATATILLSGLTQPYDGTPQPVTVTTSPASLSTSVTYAGSTTAPTLPGSYAVVATITDPNYAATESDTLNVTVTGLVKTGPTLSGGVEGSLQVLTGGSITLNGNAYISGDLLVPGTPTVVQNGHPTYGGTLDTGGGSASPSNYQITLNGNVVLRHVIRKVAPLAMPVVAAPPASKGTRNVSINSTGQSVGDFTTVNNLTLNGNVGTVAVPAGTYGTVIVNGNSGLTLGVAGATTPSVYNLQDLTLNGNGTLKVLGPVVITVANGPTINGNIGTTAHPEWLSLLVANGGVSLNGNVSFYGSVVAPTGTVTINGNTTLTGEVIASQLLINGNGLLVEPTGK